MIKPLLLALLLSGCAGQTTLELSAGQDLGITQSWRGDGPVVQFKVRRMGEDGTFCEVAHISNLRSGWPFNDRRETTLDHVSCGVSVGL